ncbi:hypothetical protein HDU85_001610 [Gaertneriomyces sp. JEL0708]|nr:hypothetical protein HDU85_001610 [Gaertneriomyces sp. JEL0708]
MSWQTPSGYHASQTLNTTATTALSETSPEDEFALYDRFRSNLVEQTPNALPRSDTEEYVKYLLEGSGVENKVDFALLRRELAVSTPNVSRVLGDVTLATSVGDGMSSAMHARSLNALSTPSTDTPFTPALNRFDLVEPSPLLKYSRGSSQNVTGKLIEEFDSSGGPTSGRDPRIGDSRLGHMHDRSLNTFPSREPSAMEALGSGRTASNSRASSVAGFKGLQADDRAPSDATIRKFSGSASQRGWQDDQVDPSAPQSIPTDRRPSARGRYSPQRPNVPEPIREERRPSNGKLRQSDEILLRERSDEYDRPSSANVNREPHVLHQFSDSIRRRSSSSTDGRRSQPSFGVSRTEHLGSYPAVSDADIRPGSATIRPSQSTPALALSHQHQEPLKRTDYGRTMGNLPASSGYEGYAAAPLQTLSRTLSSLGLPPLCNSLLYTTSLTERQVNAIKQLAEGLLSEIGRKDERIGNLLTKNQELEGAVEEGKRWSDEARALRQSLHDVEDKYRRSQHEVTDLHSQMAASQREVDTANRRISHLEQRIQEEVARNEKTALDASRIQMEVLKERERGERTWRSVVEQYRRNGGNIGSGGGVEKVMASVIGEYERRLGELTQHIQRLKGDTSSRLRTSRSVGELSGHPIPRAVDGQQQPRSAPVTPGPISLETELALLSDETNHGYKANGVASNRNVPSINPHEFAALKRAHMRQLNALKSRIEAKDNEIEKMKEDMEVLKLKNLETEALRKERETIKRNMETRELREWDKRHVNGGHTDSDRNFTSKRPVRRNENHDPELDGIVRVVCRMLGCNPSIASVSRAFDKIDKVLRLVPQMEAFVKGAVETIAGGRRMGLQEVLTEIRTLVTGHADAAVLHGEFRELVEHFCDLFDVHQRRDKLDVQDTLRRMDEVYAFYTSAKDGIDGLRQVLGMETAELGRVFKRCYDILTSHLRGHEVNTSTHGISVVPGWQSRSGSNGQSWQGRRSVQRNLFSASVGTTRPEQTSAIERKSNRHESGRNEEFGESFDDIRESLRREREENAELDSTPYTHVNQQDDGPDFISLLLSGSRREAQNRDERRSPIALAESNVTVPSRDPRNTTTGGHGDLLEPSRFAAFNDGNQTGRTSTPRPDAHEEGHQWMMADDADEDSIRRFLEAQTPKFRGQQRSRHTPSPGLTGLEKLLGTSWQDSVELEGGTMNLSEDLQGLDASVDLADGLDVKRPRDSSDAFGRLNTVLEERDV